MNRYEIGLSSPDWTSKDEQVILSRIFQPPADDPLHAEERNVHRLPALSSDFFFPNEDVFGWTPTLKTILEGTRDCSDKGSPLHMLQGHEADLVKHIYTYLFSEFAKHVTLCIPASCVGLLVSPPGMVARWIGGRQGVSNWSRRENMPHLSVPSWFRVTPLTTTTLALHVEESSDESRQRAAQPSADITGFVAFATCGTVSFPEPAHRNVNMMPFIFGSSDSLPYDLQCYFDLIEQCPYRNNRSDETGKVGYLTVHESYIEAGTAQRRPGLHIESPGWVADDRFAMSDNSCAMTPGREHGWGVGKFYGPDQYEGGFYMASSVADTSQVWDALVDKNGAKNIVDQHGSCEHLRPLLGPGTKLAANQLIWLTDCTPHEALPQPTSGDRQFFRVVTSSVTHWFAQHSTHNPLVPVPANVVIVHGNKFD